MTRLLLSTLMIGLLLCSSALAAKFCPECGAKMASEAAKFCAECGKSPAAAVVVEAATPQPVTMKHEDQLVRYFLISQKLGKRCEIPTERECYVRRVAQLGDYQVTRKFTETTGGKFTYHVRVQATNGFGQMIWQNWILRVQTIPTDKIVRFSEANQPFIGQPKTLQEEDVTATDYAGDAAEVPPLRLAAEGQAAPRAAPTPGGAGRSGFSGKRPWEK